MNNQVWKYPISSHSFQSISMPEGAEILSIDCQHGYPQLWALVNPANKIERRGFRLIATREPFDAEGLKFISTFLLESDSIVLHFFEVIS